MFKLYNPDGKVIARYTRKQAADEIRHWRKQGYAIHRAKYLGNDKTFRWGIYTEVGSYKLIDYTV